VQNGHLSIPTTVKRALINHWLASISVYDTQSIAAVGQNKCNLSQSPYLFRKSVVCLFFNRHFHNKRKNVTGVELTQDTIGTPQQWQRFLNIRA